MPAIIKDGEISFTIGVDEKYHAALPPGIQLDNLPNESANGSCIPIIITGTEMGFTAVVILYTGNIDEDSLKNWEAEDLPLCLYQGWAFPFQYE